jgi:putative membrane protein
MSAFLLEHYLVIKALHVIAMIAWMAGMLYLPRLFVYHVDAEKGSPQSETFKVMERRLLRCIINPAMMATVLFGVLMIAANPAIMQGGWIHVKLSLVFLLVICHVLFARWRKVFFRDENKRTAKYYKVWNEVPTVLMFVIVILAVVKPF